MARCSRESLLDDKITQGLRPQQLSDAPISCESDKCGNGDDDDMILDPQRHREAEKGRG
jgi:hypothetical protein